MGQASTYDRAEQVLFLAYTVVQKQRIAPPEITKLESWIEKCRQTKDEILCRGFSTTAEHTTHINRGTTG